MAPAASQRVKINLHFFITTKVLVNLCLSLGGWGEKKEKTQMGPGMCQIYELF